MKNVLTIAFLLPLFCMAQTFNGFTIKNEGKATITVGSTLKVTSVPGNSVLWLVGSTTPKADSLVITITTDVSLQLRVGVGTKISGNVVPLKGSGRYSFALALFGVTNPNSVRFYSASASKTGYEILSIAFVSKAPPIVVQPPVIVFEQAKRSYVFVSRVPTLKYDTGISKTSTVDTIYLDKQ